LEEVTVRASHEVMMEVDDNILLIVGVPLGILDQHIRLHPIFLLKFNIIVLITY
jgi:hypothetical protein